MQRGKNQTTGCGDIAYCLVEYFILSHPVGHIEDKFFSGEMTQPTVSKHWRKIGPRD